MDIEAFSATITSRHNPLLPPILLGIAAILFVIGFVILSYLTGNLQLRRTSDVEGKICGGIMGEIGPNACPEGYYCKYTEHYPDATGICAKE